MAEKTDTNHLGQSQDEDADCDLRFIRMRLTSHFCAKIGKNREAERMFVNLRTFRHMLRIAMGISQEIDQDERVPAQREN